MKTLHIEPGSPWESAYSEILYTLEETANLIERSRIHYNTVRPHASLGYRPLAPQTPELYLNRWTTLMGAGQKVCASKILKSELNFPW